MAVQTENPSVVETQQSDSNAPNGINPRVQFGIGRLMVMTAAVAVIMTISIRINAPLIAQGLLAGYLFFFAIWAIVRGPSVLADLGYLNRRRRQLKQQREDLERELKQARHRLAVMPSEKEIGDR